MNKHRISQAILILGTVIFLMISMSEQALGHETQHHPLNRGFDEFYGFRDGARSFFPLSPKTTYDRPSKQIEKGFAKYQEPEEYLTDALATEACDFMDRNHENPFFMYVSFNAVHTPLEAIEEDLAKIKSLKGKRKKLAAMTLALDRACGKILDRLKELGLEENTSTPHETLFWKKENRGVVRQGEWKMLRYPDRPAELYNIAEDETESNNLAYTYPDKVREMYKILWEWESELERPLWMLKRVYEVNAMRRMDEKRDPVVD